MNYQSERALFQEIESGKVRRDPSLALASLKQKLVDIESQPQTPEILKLKSEVEYYYGRMKALIKQEEETVKQKSKDQFNKNQIEKQYREDQKLSQLIHEEAMNEQTGKDDINVFQRREGKLTVLWQTTNEP